MGFFSHNTICRQDSVISIAQTIIGRLRAIIGWIVISFRTKDMLKSATSIRKTRKYAYSTTMQNISNSPTDNTSSLDEA